MSPVEIANRYFASVRARDIDGFMKLFAEDATVILPDGRTVSGAADIRAMESAVFAANGAGPTVPGRGLVGFCTNS